MTPIQTVAIVGAGAMGCLFAARLAAADHAVTVIDVDEARLAALGQQGITLTDDDGMRTVPVAAARAAAVAGPVDLVILFTKGMHSAAAIRSVAHLAGRETLALTLQNGLGNAETIATVWDPARILIGATDFPADLTGPTSVASHGSGHIWVGAFDGGGGEAVAAVVAALRTSGLDAVADPAVLVSIWEKVAFNAALNALATITGLTVGGMDTPAGCRIAMAVVDETVATAAAEGLTLDRAGIAAKIDHALAHHREHKASMLQDRLAGRATEIETINGAIVGRGAAAGVPTPVTATLADLVRLIESPAVV